MSGLESKCQGVRQAAYLLILCVAFLLTFGAVVIYSASMHEEGYHLLAKHQQDSNIRS
jgi:cell division protein FtsW (lipid II flippase)